MVIRPERDEDEPAWIGFCGRHLEESPDELAPGIKTCLLSPLQEEEVADRIAEAARQRREVDAVVHLDVDGLDTQQAGDVRILLQTIPAVFRRPRVD